MRSRGSCLVAVIALVAACGAPVAPKPADAPAPVAAVDAGAPSSRAESGKRFVTYVEVSADWVEEVMPAPADAVKAWAADPANAKLMLPATRHILVKVDSSASAAAQAAARKKAQAAIARLKKGEDFASIAKAVSEDPGSKDKGGLYPGDMVKHFVDPYRDAYAALAPGETTMEPVRSVFGWHVIKKENVDDAALASAFKRATAPQVARRLAGDIAERWRPAGAERAATREIGAAIDALLGQAARAGSSPAIRIFAQDAVQGQVDGICTKLRTTPHGEAKIFPDGERIFFVTKGGDEADLEATRATAMVDAPDSAWSHCSSRAKPDQLTPAQIRALMEQIQKQQQKERSDKH